MEYSIMRDIMESATETEIGEFFENCHKKTSMKFSLVKMSHSQPPTPVETGIVSQNSIVNGVSKQNTSRAIDMRFY